MFSQKWASKLISWQHAGDSAASWVFFFPASVRWHPCSKKGHFVCPGAEFLKTCYYSHSFKPAFRYRCSFSKASGSQRPWLLINDYLHQPNSLAIFQWSVGENLKEKQDRRAWKRVSYLQCFNQSSIIKLFVLSVTSTSLSKYFYWNASPGNNLRRHL